MDLAAEGTECKDVGRKPDQEGKDVYRQEQLADQHGVESSFHKASVNSCKSVKKSVAWREKNTENLHVYAEICLFLCQYNCLNTVRCPDVGIHSCIKK